MLGGMVSIVEFYTQFYTLFYILRAPHCSKYPGQSHNFLTFTYLLLRFMYAGLFEFSNLKKKPWSFYIDFMQQLSIIYRT